MKTQRTVLAAVAASLMFTAVSAYAQNNGGGGDSQKAVVPITVGGGWVQFQWGAGEPVAIDDQYTFDGAACVTVTDAFCYGDQFSVADGATFLGDTSAPEPGVDDICAVTDPDLALADPRYSSGEFFVGAGSHSIDMDAILNPFDGGAGFIRVDSCAAPGTASFEVNKVFTDGNPAEVEVTLNCFTGLPLVQSQMISESQNVKFIVESFADGELDCNVTEADFTGYSASYNDGFVDSDVDCSYDDVMEQQANVCTVTNTPDPVEVSVFKDWIIEGEGGDSIDPYYRLTLACFGEIVGGFTHGPSGIYRKSLYDGSYLGTADVEFNADVVPDWDGGTDCWVLETVFDSAVEVTNGCGSNGNPGLVVELDGGDSCTVTNTVFFEGIPTLSQYGMAILALLMLGVGFVGFRRFV